MRLRNALIIAGALALGGIGYSFAQVLPQPGPPVPIAGAYNITPPTLTDGQAGWAQLDSGGKLLVNSTFTPSGTQDVNVAKINGITPLMGNGVTGTGSQRVTIASDNTAFSVNAVQSGTWTVQPGNTANTTPWLVSATLPTTGTVAAGNGVVYVPSAETAAGITPVISAALESNHVIKASAGNFYSGYITTGATAGWLLLANSTTAPTAGGAAIAPLACVLAPANQTTSISAPTIPLIFSTGITMVFSTSGCLTNTASTTAFFSGMAK